MDIVKAHTSLHSLAHAIDNANLSTASMHVPVMSQRCEACCIAGVVCVCVCVCVCCACSNVLAVRSKADRAIAKTFKALGPAVPGGRPGGPLLRDGRRPEKVG